MESDEIKTILVDTIGESEVIKATKKYPIKQFQVNGEMASVNWYRKGQAQYNGKYVIAIMYYRK